MAEDYYGVLGIGKNAGDDEIKKAYRVLAMKHHPDKNKGDAESERKFKKIQEAYDVLRDPNKRAYYDHHGSAGPEGQGGFSGFGGGFADFDFSDLFGSAFGRESRNMQHGGSDLRYNLEISLEEAYLGKDVKITYRTKVLCRLCRGTGGKDGSQPINCATCKGLGVTRVQQGFFTMERACAKCRGVGKVIKDPCNKCHGDGRADGEYDIETSIPRGVDNDAKIKVTGKGEAGHCGGPSGDLYIHIIIKQHDFFRRSKNDLYCNIPVRMTLAALGGGVSVPYIGGKKVEINVPQGAQSGSRIRVHGKGMPALKSSKTGDLYVEINVETPINLSDRQKSLLRELDEDISLSKSSPKCDSFFKKLKSMWTDD